MNIIATWIKRLLVLLGLLITLFVLANKPILRYVEGQYNYTYLQPPYTVSQEAADLHNSLLVADMHADSSLWARDLLKRSDTGHVDIPRLIEGNIALQGFTIVTKSPTGQNDDHNSADTDRITSLTIASLWPRRTWGSLYERAVFQVDKLHQFAKDSEDKLTIIKSRKDLENYIINLKQDEAKVAAWIGIEGAHALEGSMEKLDTLIDKGVRMIGPTHFFDNEMGGSAHGISKAGLTDFGKKAIKHMELRGVTIDLAHSSAAIIDDVLAMATRPVVVSHTGVKGTCDNNRNLSDDQLRAIKKNGGVVGIGFWINATCGKDIEHIIKAIKYTTNLIGINHIALGSDFDGSVATPIDASGMALITEGLIKADYSNDDISQIMGLNTIRVLMQNLPN